MMRNAPQVFMQIRFLLLVLVLVEGWAFSPRWIAGANAGRKIEQHWSSSKDVPAQSSLLAQLQQRARVWADTADVTVVERLRRDLGVEDVTTNPSIVSAAARRETRAVNGVGSVLLVEAQAYGGDSRAISALKGHERIAVELGRRLLDSVPGRVCTQLDIRCSDAGEMVAKARGLMAMYTEAGVPRERVLIKTPATWAGIRATDRLEREGIKCLVTLVCSEVQGRAAAEAGASVIATYVGRVSDWHKTAAAAAAAAEGITTTADSLVAPAAPSASEDPGVAMTLDLKKWFVAQGFATEVMAASFRNADQVAALAGCDHLTVAPGLLQDLAKLPPRDSLSAGIFSRRDGGGRAAPVSGPCDDTAAYNAAERLDEEAFLAALRQNVCGTEVLRSSVEGFARDTLALEAAITEAQQYSS